MGVGTSVIQPGPDGVESDRRAGPEDPSRWMRDVTRPQVSGLVSFVFESCVSLPTFRQIADDPFGGALGGFGDGLAFGVLVVGIDEDGGFPAG